MNQLAGTAIPVAPDPAATAAPALRAESRVKPAAVAVAAFAGTIVLNVVDVPGIAVSHWVPLFLLASGCMAALQWKRAGVRHELRSRAAAKIEEFGGGVYGAIAMATWLQLETTDLVADVAATGSLSGFIDSLSIGWLISQAMESIGFAIRAGLWPWHWFSPYGMRAVIIAAVAAWLLDEVLKRLSARYAELRAPKPAPAA